MDPRLGRRGAETPMPEHPAPEGPVPQNSPPEHPDREHRVGERTTGELDGIRAATDGAFRDDLERIRFSPYFSRLAAVTQVISQGAAGQVVHNRLTHTIKVTAVARSVATALRRSADAPLLDTLGGCDPVVVQAAASAHDLGHPPFGHLGEQTLDRVARWRFGLADGFE